MTIGKHKGFAFVGIQFLCIIYIALTGPIFASITPLLIIEVVGIFLGIWAIFEQKLGNFNITPNIKKHSKLITTGPYKLIRHPMYTSILLAMSAITIDAPSFPRIFAFILLFVDLVLKLNYEEKLLKENFKDYNNYMKRTKKLIPFVY